MMDGQTQVLKNTLWCLQSSNEDEYLQPKIKPLSTNSNDNVDDVLRALVGIVAHPKSQPCSRTRWSMGTLNESVRARATVASEVATDRMCSNRVALSPILSKTEDPQKKERVAKLCRKNAKQQEKCDSENIKKKKSRKTNAYRKTNKNRESIKTKC